MLVLTFVAAVSAVAVSSDIAGKRCVVTGASGGIGHGFVEHLIQSDKVDTIYAFSRSEASFESDKVLSGHLDLSDEASIEKAAASIEGKPDITVVASGVLHDGDLQPEKSLRDLNMDNFEQVFTVNAFGPALVAKHFLPLIDKEARSVFAVVTGRVGSIEDNYLGGWYAYRASKSAMHMLVRNAAIETGRRFKNASIISIHPGTVDTDLSEPFSGNVKPEKLFSPAQSTGYMLDVIDNATAEQSGKLFAYDGEIIPY